MVNKMMRRILAFFGYVKIPRAVVRLSMAQEDFLRRCMFSHADPKEKRVFCKFLEGQSAITAFLRSGRFLGEK